MISKVLDKLVTFKTLSADHVACREALIWIKEQIIDLPLHISLFESEGFPSLIITSRKTKSPKLWLQAHLDIVPAPDELFKARYKGSKMFARGTYDMKYATACYIQLLRDIGNDLPNYDFGVMITTDEEIGGFNGVAKLLNSGYSSKLCFLPDGGDSWCFQESAKGILQLKIEATGKSSHGSRPWEGENAIEILVSFLQEIKELFSKEPCDDKSHYHNSINVGKISGGEATNQVPNLASANLDIRFIPETNSKKIFSDISKIAAMNKNISVSKTVDEPAIKTDKKNKHIKLFSKIVLDKYKIKTGFTKSHGSSDARHFAKHNIPTVLIRPVGGSIHSDLEWIDTKELDKFYGALKEFVSLVAK